MKTVTPAWRKWARDYRTVTRIAEYAEHAWMERAVKTWTGGNPYAPDREGQPEFNGAFR